MIIDVTNCIANVTYTFLPPHEIKYFIQHVWYCEKNLEITINPYLRLGITF